MDSRGYGLLRLLVCATALVLPVNVFAECRVIEYPDHNEVVCDADAVPQSGQQPRKAQSKLETTEQKEFEFYTPARAGSKITIYADLSPTASASQGETLLTYRLDELMNKEYNTTIVTFVYDQWPGEEITIREEGTGERAGTPKITSVRVNDKTNHLLFNPFKSGCSSSAADSVYLKINRMDGERLYYQIILPPCLSRLVEQSIPD